MDNARTIIGMMVFGFGCGVSSVGYADERRPPGWLHEVKLGVLHHDTGGLWSGFRRESGADFNLEAIFSPQYKILGGFIRPALGGSVNTAGDTSKLYSGIRWQYDHASGIFFGVGFGGAVHNGDLHLQHYDRKALGSRVLFHIPVEIGYRVGARSSLSVYFDHVSNANLADANEGMDTFGGRYGYRF
ncbi:acyloxyacyl hydrolase [Nitrosospira lacus]|uniref:acyloxyacyl hydrolase n=1 Tax=Nitrosospira lacus TaxID=1288494 RepID=UPI001D131B2D|nr:acyloxyacyl hydrolase [Nitrosospira lacus]